MQFWKRMFAKTWVFFKVNRCIKVDDVRKDLLRCSFPKVGGILAKRIGVSDLSREKLPKHTI